jgi:hypothetical protein
MEILWPSVGISVLVCLVFYILAQHWRRVLRRHSWMLRQLGERLRALEEVSDPEFRKRLGESSPMPLEQVFTFSFRLSEQFWRGTLALTDKDWEFVRRFGSFVGSVKLERWRSHTVATITEALPASATAQWQKRSLDLYAGDGKEDGAISIWQLPLRLPTGTTERPPALELVLDRNAIKLCGDWEQGGKVDQANRAAASCEATIFRVPLDFAQLAEFRRREPAGGREERGPNSMANGPPTEAASWRAFYAFADERVGFEWQLGIRDLVRKADWDRWKILEPAEMRAARP